MLPLNYSVYKLCMTTDKRSFMPHPETNTIDDVLAELDAIIEITIAEDSPLGIFAYVYRRTTAKIAKGIAEGRFEDADRMEQFDVRFARFYIEAFHKYREGEPISEAWQVAFEAADNGDAIIMQHLLLGMNAHINLDLGIAAARTAPGNQIMELEHDFMLVNTLLAELVDEVQGRISRVSPLMFLLDWIGERTDEAIVNFSIEKARGFAWEVARRLARADSDDQEAIINEVDEEISGLGRLVANPPGTLVGTALSIIRLFEEKNTARLIEKLQA